MEAVQKPNHPNVVTRLIEDIELHRTIPDEPASAALPQVPGFELLEVLGEGGMGIVYKARNRALKRLVALKMIAPEHSSPNSRRRFQREAETVARLQHPNVVQIYDVSEHEGRPFLALELIDGGTLAQHLAKSGSMPAREAALLVATLARAMQYAHEQNVIHRDLKPSNILLQHADSRVPIGGSRDETMTESAVRQAQSLVPKITDFGLARILDDGNEHTKTGAILGTPAYMAPEQAAGRGEFIGPATDIYALGVLLYEALTGRPPFSGESSWDVLVQIIHTDPTPPSKLRPQLARDLDTICLKALAKHPLQRYASAAAMAEDLERFVAGEAIAARPEGRLSKIMRKVRRHPIRVAAAILLVGAIGIAALYSTFVRAETHRALKEGREHAKNGSYDEAALRFQQASRLAVSWPVARDLQRELNLEWRGVRRRQIAGELHGLAELLRYRFDPDSLTSADQRTLARECRRVWDAREDMRGFHDGDRDPEWLASIEADLLDIALLSNNLRVRLAEGDGVRIAHEEALSTLAEIESLYGPSLAVALERQLHEQALGRTILPLPTELKPKTAWEFYVLGRTRLIVAQSQSGYQAAAEALNAAIDLDPEEPVFQFAAGRAALLRGDYHGADRFFSVCISKCRQSRDVCYYNHGLAMFHWQLAGDKNALNDYDKEALKDFDKAINLNPQFAAAWLNRGLMHHRQGRSNEAIRDLQQALVLGASRALAHYNLAVVHESARDLTAARQHVGEALVSRPDYAEALQLQKRLGKP